jgi:hypothetical protein
VDGATVSVAVVSSRTEAELIAGMLRSRGVSAAVSADDAGGQYPQMAWGCLAVVAAWELTWPRYAAPRPKVLGRDGSQPCWPAVAPTAR